MSARALEDDRKRVLAWLGAGSRSYAELLEQYTGAVPTNGVDTRQAFAVLIGSMVGEGLLEREVAPDGDPEVGAISRLWLSEKGKRSARTRGRGQGSAVRGRESSHG